MTQVYNIDGVEYEQESEINLLASKVLADAWVQLGKPDSPLSDAGEKIMRAIFVVWEELDPVGSKEWLDQRKEYQSNELSINEQVHRRTGRSLATYPLPVFAIMKKMFPKFKFGDRESVIKLVRKYPQFRMANRV